MDEVLNPYAPGAGTPPPELAGRDREQTSFGVLLKRLAAGRPEQNLALWGLRGVGKTVLLNRFASEAEDAGWGTGYVELRGRGRRVGVPAQIAAKAANRSLAARASGSGCAGRCRHQQLLGDGHAGAGIMFQVEVDPMPGRGDSGQLDVDLQDVLVRPAGTAGAADGRVSAPFFDQTQVAEEERPAGAQLAALPPHR